MGRVQRVSNSVVHGPQQVKHRYIHVSSICGGHPGYKALATVLKDFRCVTGLWVVILHMSNSKLKVLFSFCSVTSLQNKIIKIVWKFWAEYMYMNAYNSCALLYWTLVTKACTSSKIWCGLPNHFPLERSRVCHKTMLPRVGGFCFQRWAELLTTLVDRSLSSRVNRKCV